MQLQYIRLKPFFKLSKMHEDAFKQDLHVTRFTTVSPFVARLLLTKYEISFISLMFPQQT